MNYRTFILTGVLAIIAGMIAYTAFAGFFVYQNLSSRNDQASRVLRGATITRYGTVLSIDTANRILTVVAPDPYSAGATQTFKIRVPADTEILQQQLVTGIDGIYEGQSFPKPGTLSDIVPTTRIRVQALSAEGGLLVSQRLLFGNPL